MYDPAAPNSSVAPRTVVLVVAVAVAALGAAALLRLVDADRDADPVSPLAFEPVSFDRGITDLGDGWYRIEIDDGAAAVDLPGPLVRTRDDLLIGGFGELPLAVWGGGRADDEGYAVAMADLPDAWRDRSIELLTTIPLPVGLDVLESDRRPTTVAGRPAVEIEANGPDGQIRAVVVANDDRLVMLVYGNRTPAATPTVLARMLGSLSLT